jgi:hypothetical protein
MKPHQTPPPFPGLVACTAKNASYAPEKVTFMLSCHRKCHMKLPSLKGFIVDRTYVFNRRSTLKDRSAEALVTGIVNMIHKMVSIEGYSTGFTASSVSQSEVGI